MLYVLPRKAGAQQEFTVNYDTTYVIADDGSAEVNQGITLSNNYSETYASSYDLILEGPNPLEVRAIENETELPIQVKKEKEQTIISASFPRAVVGKGKNRSFSIKYKLNGVAIKNGQVWEITIPKVVTPETINSKVLTLYVPKDFGLAAYISPEPKRKDSTDNLHIFTFEKEDLLKAGVVAAFGKFQIFAFNLTYHLENTSSTSKEQTIALIPDTSFQRALYSSINPKPKNVSLDVDGNWIASYNLKGKERLDVAVAGSVQVFAEAQNKHPHIAPSGNEQLKESAFWEVKDPEVQELAKEFKTPRNIYDFITTLLEYDYSRVSQNSKRLGAKGTLLNPLTSVCREFTDLFVTLTRAAGIPAREINGFAYTENPEIQPLSLVADVLHAWPEYWDEKKRMWIPTDPTWGKTTGGIDFFDKFDLSHVTFAIHGVSSETPFPAGSYKVEDNPQKDVSIAFGPLPSLRSADIKLRLDKKSLYIPFLPTTFLLTVENVGTAASYKLPLKLSSSGLEDVSGFTDKISFLAPFTKNEVTLTAKSPFLDWKKEKSIQVKALEIEQAEIKDINIQIPQAEVVVAESIVLFGGITLGVVLLYLTKHAISRKTH